MKLRERKKYLKKINEIMDIEKLKIEETDEEEAE